MVETSENVKKSLEAACSETGDENPNDNSSEKAASTLPAQPNSEEKSKTEMKNQQDEVKSNQKDEPSANGECESSQENGPESSANENPTVKDSNVSLTASESAQKNKSDKCSTKSDPILNGEKLEDKTSSVSAEENSDTCEPESKSQDLKPVQSKEKTDEIDTSDKEGLPTTETSVEARAENIVDKPVTEGDGADLTPAVTSESPKDKSGSIKESNTADNSDDKDSKSTIGKDSSGEEKPDEDCKTLKDDAKKPEDSTKYDSCEEVPVTNDKERTSKKKKSSKPPPILNKSGRSTRSSNNPDFAAKQRSFLNKVQNAYSSIKLLEASSSMSESEGDEDLSDSSYSDEEEERAPKPPPSAEKKTPPVDKKVVGLPPGLAEKLAEKSRALLTEKKHTVPFTIGDKRLAPLSTEKSLVTMEKKTTNQTGEKKGASQLLPNGFKRKSSDGPMPIITMFRRTKVVHELDEEQTLLVPSPSSSKAEVPASRKRKASSSLEAADGENGGESQSPVVKATTSAAAVNKKAKLARPEETGGKDSQVSCDVYCWFCHREGATVMCKTCPRVYHIRCLVAPPPDHSPGKWVCPLCVTILKAETTDNRSRAMKMLTLDQFCLLLSFTVARMKSYTGAEAFCKPVDPKEFPMYSYYIVYPMDISQLERNIKSRVYGSTEAFLADAAWILHNCAIFNSLNNKLTHMAKQVLKICRQEIADIENCPDCYLHAHSGNEEWFLEVCRRPHLLVWAKLKGFPFWPAKAMQCNPDGMVDVRFFGAHDRAWVPAKECVLYNRSHNLQKKKKKSTLDSCIEELEKHVNKLESCFGSFIPAAARVPLEPKRFDEQLQSMLPSYKYAEAMKMPIAFSNDSLVKACEENLKEAYTYIEAAVSAGSRAQEDRDESSQVTDEDGDVTHSDSLQSDKEETPTGRPTKRAKLARETALKTTPVKTAAKSVAKGIERPRRETRKSGIVDRLSEKLALLDDDLSRTPPPLPAETPEPMDTDSQTPTKTPEVAPSAEKPPETEVPLVKTEPPSAENEDAETAVEQALETEPPRPDTSSPMVDGIKREEEDSLDGVGEAATEAAFSDSQSDSPSKDGEPSMKRRSTTRAATAASVSTKQKAAPGSKAKGKVAAADGGKKAKSKATPATAGGGVAFNRKGQAKTANAAGEAPKTTTTTNSAAGVAITSPQEKFTARKSVPGGNNPKNISLMKASPLPPSMSASPTAFSSAVRLQTSTPNQQSVQVLATPGMPSLTVAPAARNVSLLNSAAKTASATSSAASAATPLATLMTSSAGNGGTIVLNSGSAPTAVSSASVSTSTAAAEAPSNMPALSSAPSLAKTTVTTTSPLSGATSPFAPALAGPHAAGIRSHAAKLTEFFCGLIEDTIKDVGGKGNASATIKALQVEFERLNWQHSQEMAELRHNTTLVVEEIKKAFETEKVLAVKDAVAARTTLSLKEKEAAIIATKRKQWCAFCLKEALFYCCWNTSYCDYSCQQKHWPVHSMYCTQNENSEDPSGPNVAGAGTPKPLIIKTPTSANGASPAVAGTLMPVISARSSVSLSGSSTTPTYVLATTMPSTSPSGSTILVQAGSRPAGVRPVGPTTTVGAPRPYVIPQGVRLRPNTPGQKVVLRPGVKPNPGPGASNQVVFVVNNQKK